MNHAIEVLKEDEEWLEYCFKKGIDTEKDLIIVRQAITDLEDLEAQDQMRREGEG